MSYVAQKDDTIKEYGVLPHYIVTMLSIHVLVNVPTDFYIETKILVQPVKYCEMHNDHTKAFNTKFLGSTHSIMFNILRYIQTEVLKIVKEHGTSTDCQNSCI